MSKNKLKKFAAMTTFPNVLQNKHTDTDLAVDSEGVEISTIGKWKDLFPVAQPITLELACGRGEYTIGLAEKYPKQNFIGIDVKGARMHQGATFALERKLENVRFLRMRIERIKHYFGPGEVDEIWITFPDPFRKKENRRLTSFQFLKRYAEILKPGGRIHLKTDDPDLFKFSTKMALAQGHNVVQCDDIYAKSELPHVDLDLKTYYEKMHLDNNKTIKYLSFTLLD